MASIYTLTIFSSAFLMFLIEPMIARLLLPHLGGSPAVWNTSMMFFQVLLLLGYAYAHAGVHWLGIKKQTTLHMVLLVVALAWLPLTVHTELGFASIEHPISWMILSLFLSIGFPFFVLAANAPLLQSWLAHTDHNDAHNPYFLYSASNAGSLLALLAYPFVVEPLFDLPEQRKLWSGFFIFFIILLGCCTLYVRRRYIPLSTATTMNAAEPTARDKLRWLALAFIPSSLLLGVTTYITTDIASMPLFWVIPLAIYLLTFIMAFARIPCCIELAITLQIVLVPLTCIALAFKMNGIVLILCLHLLTFFAITLGCHGTMAQRRPEARHLTQFYLWVSFGGMLGGVFNALIAPLIFTAPIEYAMMLVLAMMLRPQAKPRIDHQRAARLDLIIPCGFFVFLLTSFWGLEHLISSYPKIIAAANVWLKPLASANDYGDPLLPILTCLLIGIFVTMSIAASGRPLRFTLLMASTLIATPFTDIAPNSNDRSHIVYAERNFFGVNRVARDTQHNAMVLVHGTTLHGTQSLGTGDRLQLTSYFEVMGDIFGRIPADAGKKPVAILGLGAGTLACLGHKGQHFDFYEIDPAVAAIASNPDFFTFLRDCPPTKMIHLGDGRLTLAATQTHYGFIVIDTFSSDAIPMHLITREAFHLYMDRLTTDGVIAINISNRHLNLAPVMAALAHDAGLAAIIKEDLHPKGRLTTASVWVVMARKAEYLAAIQKADTQWKQLQDTGNTRVWTDSYSNILAAFF